MGRPRSIDWPEMPRLREMLVTMSYTEIAHAIGCSRHALYSHLKSNGLIGCSPHGKHKPKTSSVHHVRVSVEFDGCMRAREPWSQASGPLAYWRQQGVVG